LQIQQFTIDPIQRLQIVPFADGADKISLLPEVAKHRIGLYVVVGSIASTVNYFAKGNLTFRLENFVVGQIPWHIAQDNRSYTSTPGDLAVVTSDMLTPFINRDDSSLIWRVQRPAGEVGGNYYINISPYPINVSADQLEFSVDDFKVLPATPGATLKGILAIESSVE
jgi:hypothetical protein